MLKRKEQVETRQFYRRVACNVQSALNEICLNCNNEEQVKNVSHVKEVTPKM